MAFPIAIGIACGQRHEMKLVRRTLQQTKRGWPGLAAGFFRMRDSDGLAVSYVGLKAKSADRDLPMPRLRQ